MHLRTCIVAFIAVMSAFLTTCSARSSSIPPFKKPECEKFRVTLKEHSDVSRFDRKHSTNLGIAGVVLFWVGAPGVPLGISAIVMGRRMDTAAREELESMKVTEDNYKRINELCGKLLGVDKLNEISFRGQNNTAIVLGAVALALSVLTMIMQVCYGSLLCCGRESKGSGGSSSEEEDTDGDEGAQGV